MSNYSDNPNSCRVDFFKPSGKWYATEAIVIPNSLYHQHPVGAVTNAIELQIGKRMSGMTAVCLHPYVENPFPVMIKVENSIL